MPLLALFLLLRQEAGQVQVALLGRACIPALQSSDKGGLMFKDPLIRRGLVPLPSLFWVLRKEAAQIQGALLCWACMP